MKKQILFILTALLLSWGANAQMTLEFNTILSDGTTITLPLNGAVDVEVEWGDGTHDRYAVPGEYSHTYSNEDIYTVEISGTLDRFGTSTTGFDFSKLTEVTSFGDLGLKSLSGAFSGAFNLEYVPYTLPTTVTDLGGVFYNATKFNQDIRTWNVSNVTSMGAMFENATSFNQDIRSWNVSNVTDMMAMFKGATSFDQDISTWDISKVYDMGSMFDGVTLSTENYDKLLIGWVTQTVVEEIEFDGGNSRFSPGEAANARAVLTDLHAWIITDGGNSSFTHIPDANFLQALKDLGHGTGFIDNYIPTANLSGIISLNVSSKNISNLTGIQDFVALEQLRCNNNVLTNLDVSKNIKLTTLYCQYNLQIPILDISKNTKLTSLFCTNNKLLSLDVSKNTVLVYLNCSNNMISVLDVSKNSKLESLYCMSSGLTSIDIRNGNNAIITGFDATNNPDLSCIYVDDTDADFSKWTKDATATFANNEVECGSVAYTHIPDNNFLQALKDLGHGTGAIGNYIPTSNLSAITLLNVSNKNISDLTGIQDFTTLYLLDCSNNDLLVLDISNNTNLVLLSCDGNNISVLDVSKNTALGVLMCSENELNLLDVSENLALVSLKCNWNNLTVLDVSANTALEELECFNNEITSIDIRNGNNAAITALDATNNLNLTCIYVDDKTADLSAWIKDATTNFVDNEAECTAITVVNDIKMESISIFPNPTKGILHFDLSGEIIQKINILDIMGKTVFEKNKLNPSETVDISGFANGMYMVVMQTNIANRSFKIVKE